MKVDLHKLANTPGAGIAELVLKRNGLWDEYHGLPEREFRVRVEYEVRETCDTTVTIKARCEDEAEEKACKKVEEDAGFDVEIFDAEVTAIAKAEGSEQ